MNKLAVMKMKLADIKICNWAGFLKSTVLLSKGEGWKNNCKHTISGKYIFICMAPIHNRRFLLTCEAGLSQTLNILNLTFSYFDFNYSLKIQRFYIYSERISDISEAAQNVHRHRPL